MRKFYLSVLGLTFFWGMGQESKQLAFTQLDRQGMQTELLMTEMKPFSALTGEDHQNINAYQFSNSFRELASVSTDGKLAQVHQLYKGVQYAHQDVFTPIGLIHVEYDRIKPEAYENQWVQNQNGQWVKTGNQAIYEKIERTLVSPLVARKKGLKTIYSLDGDYFVNTTSNEIVGIEANFDDGLGFRNLNLGQQQTVLYQQAGKKNLSFIIHFDNGTLVEKQAHIEIEYSNQDLMNFFNIDVQTITADYAPDLAIYGESDQAKGVCEYEIFLSPDGVLDKPIFVVDGFDPGDARDVQSVYNMLAYEDSDGNQQHLADYMRNEEGYDIVIVNFPTYVNSNGMTIDGGADYIERNALSLATVIKLVNQQKVGDEENVIIGPSMGGLISRYALRYMEMNNIPHETRLWISFDSPHNGANVPISLQYLFNYFGYGYADIDEVKIVVDGMLRSAAAKQMLVDHLDGHGDGVLTPKGAPNYRNNFQSRMDNMGFPQTTRNISITNGSGTGKKFLDKQGNPVNPDFKILDGTVNTGTILGLNTRVNLLVKYMPYANVTSEVTYAQIQAQIIVWVNMDTFTASAKQNPESDGIDSAPGGLFDLSGLAGSVGDNPVLVSFMNALKAESFNFIPVTSSMALYNQPNYYHNIDLGEGDQPWDDEVVTNSQTPFVNWFMADDNEKHVLLTDGNVEFTMCEIIRPDYDFSISGSPSVEICVGDDFTSSFNLTNPKGCYLNAEFEVSGAPSGSTVTLTPDHLTSVGSVTLTGSNFPAGEYTLSVFPSDYPEKAISLTVIVHDNNPDLSGQTEFSLDNGASYTQGESVTVNPGANVNLRIPAELFDGTVDWLDPAGNSRGSNPFIENVQAGSTEEGVWHAIVSFDTDCGLDDLPTAFPFEIIVDSTTAGINENSLAKIQVYPNPTKDIIYIDGVKSKSTVKVQILDAKGSLVQNHVFNNAAEMKIFMSHLPSGTYIMKLEVDGQVLTKKISKL